MQIDKKIAKNKTKASRISRTGGVIAAAGSSAAKPVLRLGAISIVQRIVMTFQQAGVFPIVVVTGVQADEVRYQLAGRGVVFLHNENYSQAELFDSARLGMEYLNGICERLVFTPVNSPLVTPRDLARLLRTRAGVSFLSHNRQSGHPVAISAKAVGDILADTESRTLRDAIAKLPVAKKWVSTKDEGVLLTVHDEEKMRRHIANNHREYFHPHLSIGLENEEELMSPRLKTLLFLVLKTNSVALACKQLALSISTAWEMINRLEKALGKTIIKRSRGGSSGSASFMQESGVEFLRAWQKYEEAVQAFSEKQFERLFLKMLYTEAR